MQHLPDIVPDTVFKDILPVMRRFNIMPTELKSQMQSAMLAHPTLRGLMLYFRISDDDCLPCTAPRFLVERDGRIDGLPWQSMADENLAELDMADLLLRVASDTDIWEEIRSTSDCLPVCVGQSDIKVLFFPECIIISHEEVGAYVEDHSHYFDEEPDKETTRAPLCTIIMDEEDSAHAVIEDHSRLTRSMQVFREMNSQALLELVSAQNIRLADPSPSDLQRVKPLWE
jgi:hypothetical protein